MKYLDFSGLTAFWNKLKEYFVTTESYEEDTLVVAAALTDLNERKLDAADLPSWASNDTKPTYTATEVGALPVTTNYAGSTSVAGPANKAVSIPFGQVDSTSTATAFTATVDGITELRDGVCVYLKNGVITSAANCTLNINGLGAKRIYYTMAEAGAVTTHWNINYTELFVYNSTRVSGGCWDMFFGYYSDANTVGYDIRDYYIRKPVKNALYRYQFLFTCMDGTLLPANSDSNVTAATHVLTKESFNPWGQVYYYNSTTTVNAGDLPATNTLYSQGTYIYPDLRYSFNTASTLVANNDIYIKCIPQPDGSAILADDAIVFALPTYEDGFIYKRLGKAYDTYRIILEQDKPVYYYKDGIKLWTGYNLQEGVMVTDEFTKKDSSVTSDVRIKSIGGKTVVWNQLYKASSHTSEGITRTKINNITIRLQGTPTNTQPMIYNANPGSVIVDHVYYTKGVLVDGTWPEGAKLSSPWGYIRTSSVAVDIEGQIKKANGSYSALNLQMYLCPLEEIDFTMRFVIVDLTQMFGTGNEPTLEEFEAMFPEDSYAYDEGRIVNVAMSGMKSLDADGNDLDSAELDVTTLTGVADGGSTSEIIFPNGMNGIGDVRDEVDLVNGKAVKRIGVVDMGTLTYSYVSAYGVAAKNSDNPTLNAKATSTNNKIGNIIAVGYINTSFNNLYNHNEGRTISYIALTDIGSITIVLPDTITTAADAKTYLSGVYCYYELETPIEYTLDTTPSCSVSVVKGGKEMILPYNASEPQCAPAKVVEEYKASGLSDKDLKNLATTAFVQEEISSQLGNIETLQIDHGTNDTIYELTPNVLHVWGTVSSLTLTLATGTSGIVNEYMFQFDSGSTATVLNLPNTISWVQTLTPEANKTYQVSIVNNIALWICV